MLSKTHHETLEFIFGSKIPGHGLRFRMWPGTSPLRLASTHLLGESGKLHISSKTKRAKCFPKMVHRRLLGYNQAGNVSKRLDRLEWTAAYLRNTLSYWIIRSGGAANFIPALPSARAPRCLLCSFVRRALMVCDTLRIGNSNDIFCVLMLRVKPKLYMF